jgi:hypothetical protein
MGCGAAQSLDPTEVIPDIAIRLADEGVPLRAIARAIKMSSDLLRERLQIALDAGELFDLPRDDWFPGFSRDQRALHQRALHQRALHQRALRLSHLALQNRAALNIAMQQILSLTPTQAEFLLALLQNSSVPKTHFDLATKTIDVHMYWLRQRMLRFGIVVETVWGYGYQMRPNDRRKVMDMILQRVKSCD